MWLVVVIAFGLVALVGLRVYKECWHSAKPGEALIISGLGAKAYNRDTVETLGFKIVVGKGAMVLPGFQVCRPFSLKPRSVDVSATCETSDGTEVSVHCVVGYRVGDDVTSIAEAARRFLDAEAVMDLPVRKELAGRLRSVVRKTSAVDLDRDRLADRVGPSFARRLGLLGLVVDALTIQDIEHLVGEPE